MPIGVLNRNPSNLIPINREYWQRWPGAKGTDNYGHLVFINRFYGIRAILINLRAYKRKHHLATVYGLVYRWIPKQNTKLEHDEYIKSICAQLHVDPFQKLDFEDKQTREALAKAIIYYEEGYDPYTPETYKRAFNP